MDKLAKARLRANLKQSLQYLSLVFNDFFVLALLFLVGAVMFWYAQSLKQLPTGKWYYPLLAVLLLWLPSLTGRLVTLLKPADQQFLLTQDRYFASYLRKMRRYSLILPTLLLLLMAGVVFPFAFIKAQLTASTYGAMIGALFLSKYSQLRLAARQLYFNQPKLAAWIHLGTLVLVILIAYSQLWFLAVLSLGWGYLWHSSSDEVNWLGAIAQEQQRKNTIYAIYAMFTDVPERQLAIKRRRYLDWLLAWSKKTPNPNLFLYQRLFLRNPAYLSLVSQMVCFSVLLSLLVANGIWNLGLAMLVAFLTVYQLAPLIQAYDYQLMYLVLPIDPATRHRAGIQVIAAAINGYGWLVGLSWLCLLPWSWQVLWQVPLLLIWVNLLAFGYLPLRMKKMEQK